MKLELAKIRSQVARGVLVLRPVQAQRLGLDPLREAQRHEVVDRRRAQAAPLRAGTSSPRSGRRRAGRRAARPSAGRGGSRPCRSACGIERRPHLDVEPGERLLDPLAPLRARRPERDQLVLAAGRLGEPGDHAADVVPDPGARARERADVDDDAHRASTARGGRRAASEPVSANQKMPSRDEVERDRAAAARDALAERGSSIVAESTGGERARERDPIELDSAFSPGRARRGASVTEPCGNGYHCAGRPERASVFVTDTSSTSCSPSDSPAALRASRRAAYASPRPSSRDGLSACTTLYSGWRRLRRRAPKPRNRPSRGRSRSTSSSTSARRRTLDEARLARRPPRGTRGRRATRASRTAPSRRSGSARPPSPAPGSTPSRMKSWPPGTSVRLDHLERLHLVVEVVHRVVEDRGVEAARPRQLPHRQRVELGLGFDALADLAERSATRSRAISTMSGGDVDPGHRVPAAREAAR